MEEVLESLMTPEGIVKKRVKRILDEYGAYQHWPVQNGMGAPCLDCHGCFKGQYFAVEAKAPKKTMTPRQKQTARAIEQSGGTVFVIDGNAGFELLESWLVSVAENSLTTTDQLIWQMPFE